MGAESAAMAQFGCLVADALIRPLCGQWDYKQEIGLRNDLNQNAQRVNFCSIGHNEEVIFYYDIWTNIHFGYLGRVGGFSEQDLLKGADMEQTVSHPGSTQDDPSDKIAIQIGIDLYRNGLTEQTLLRQIYAHKYQLNKAKMEDDRIVEIYR